MVQWLSQKADYVYLEVVLVVNMFYNWTVAGSIPAKDKNVFIMKRIWHKTIWIKLAELPTVANLWAKEQPEVA